MQFTEFYRRIIDSPLQGLLTTLPPILEHWYKENLHGEFHQWQKTIKNLPDVTASQIELKDKVSFGTAEDIVPGQLKRLEVLLKQFMPWRKGPFDLFDMHIDTEWRSDWKWDRVLPHLTPLKGRAVLDVGCGSGYHMWRMLGEEADIVVGADPSQLFLAQFQCIHKYNPSPDIHLLPLGIEELPKSECFDTVFSMGVLYHRRSPLDFLSQLKDQLRKGGELVLETIVIDGDQNQVLVPGERYAKMRNVWFIPSCDALKHWMERVGFKDVRVVDIDTTSLEEQRKTDWMENESLEDFLDADDLTKTIEGYPAPKRAVVIATK
ncbi:tRNA 5-methoxyuridine(34)/uridine 5-oxyacetic acid(34) synthase CmoB [Catenovulum sp. SM1970]|uniref:tRNA 5-methoxyuridine(34)/uridine 5-oxyacetic acid(34) synthase CmoB n=1 Tax=Marinifaba aquimaris TaxID=2741323 RepID=UPI001573982A|nr:tRNA 5-methoxyuridine(34)/uridine 5-oxyacetic acid(34) synthase CmoB [Marinifaba aquimaris]NTS78115.1 tRNA 5-methoxyuridine(34)/uridine 5-oxyacetic acid(34) synthase CmoB [Marinifaba aquimaris]